LPPIGLGGMPMSLASRPSEEQSFATIAAALDGGMRLVDTADVYCIDQRDIGHNERLLAEGIRRWGGSEKVFVATKGGLLRPDGRWTRDGRPEHLRSACEASLKALGTDQIWLYQLHAPDDDVPFEDSVGALARLRAEGKILHVGLSNVSSDQIRAALAIVPVASVQNRLNPLDVRPFREGVIRTCEELGLAFLAYSPVGGGRDRIRIGGHPLLTEVGRPLGLTSYQVALAWLIQASPVIFAIPGSSKPATASSSAAVLRAELPADAVARLDAAFLGAAR
jgi:aryl-alcohol dehydrogenase-like predicted oxidoreductase